MARHIFQDFIRAMELICRLPVITNEVLFVLQEEQMTLQVFKQNGVR